MHVLLTGAFGNLGRSTIEALLARGHSVRCFDLRSPRNERVARKFAGRVEVVWGDLTSDADVAEAVRGVEAVVHDAAILPPLSEQHEALARRVNVDGTERLIRATERLGRGIPFVYASSFSVFGPSQPARGIATADSPVEATDVYSSTKLACEAMLRASTLGWTILRVAAAVEGTQSAIDRATLRLLFEIDPENPIEVVHGDDVARAQAAAVDVEGARRKVLLIGGGPSCQIRQRDLLGIMFEVARVGALPDEAFGRSPYYTCWMDTSESQALLDYQRHTFEEIRRAVGARVGPFGPLIAVARPITRRLLLSLSGPYKGKPVGATWKAILESA